MTTRRARLAGLGPLAAVPLVTAATPARAAAGPVPLRATRTRITLPVAPPLGATYGASFDLAGADGGPAGTAWSSSAVVGVPTRGPVVFGVAVLRPADGEIHYQRVIDRFGDYPRTATGAILGGTGTYASAAGSVDVSWPDDSASDLAVPLA